VILGFTGTREGMNVHQKITVRDLFHRLLTELHHGDAVGADYEADCLAIEYTSAQVIVHPPTNHIKRAYCAGPRHTVLRPEPFLRRNRTLVRAGCDGLIAAPEGFTEPRFLRGEGTWTTVGYARKAKRHIWIVFPDGTIREEQATP